MDHWKVQPQTKRYNHENLESGLRTSLIQFVNRFSCLEHGQTIIFNGGAFKWETRLDKTLLQLRGFSLYGNAN